MILRNEKYSIDLSTAKIFKDCIKHNLDIENELYMWFPCISEIIVNSKETIIYFKNEIEELNLGYTGIEWTISNYIDSFYIS